MLAEARKLSLFNTLEALDSIVNKFKMLADNYLRRGKKNFLAVVEYLRRYSCKTLGVSFCKVATMVKNLGISESTLHRIIKRLVDLGLVKKHYTFDENGAQLSNYYQLQNEIDWISVVEKLETPVAKVVDAFTGDAINLSETQDDTHIDTRNDTPPPAVKPSQDKYFWAIPDKGSFLYSFKSFKNIYESKENSYPIGSFPFYNWLEDDETSVESDQQGSSMQLPNYLLR